MLTIKQNTDNQPEDEQQLQQLLELRVAGCDCERPLMTKRWTWTDKDGVEHVRGPRCRLCNTEVKNTQ